MKQDIRSNFWIKALAFLLAMACGVAALLGWFYTIFHWYNIFEPEDYTATRAYTDAMNQSISYLNTLLRYYDRTRRGEALTYLEQQQYDIVRANLSPAQTNFRFTVRDNETGELLLSSSGENSLDNAESVYAGLRYLYPDTREYTYHVSDGEYTNFFDQNGEMVFRVPGQTDNPYLSWQVTQYAVEYGCDNALAVQDGFYAARNGLAGNESDVTWFYLSIALTVTFLLLTVFLMSCAGRRKGAENFTLNWSDKIPYDLYFCAMALAGGTAFGYGFFAVRELFYFETSYQTVFFLMSAGLFALGFLLFEAGIMSTATRFKTHTLLRNTLCWRILLWCWKMVGWLWGLCKATARSMGEMVGALPLTGRVIVGSVVYLTINCFLAAYFFLSYNQEIYFILLLLFNGGVLFAICAWTVQWTLLRQRTRAILSGQPGAYIDTDNMRLFPDLRAHAEALNDLGSAINTAVEERLRSERMKAELITNVSHDLKTPLTSIINYVDLLKKEDIQEEKAREYLEVLDRKSQRLKKLTEDLVEASKASTGTLAVNAERLGVVQLVEQALGEYSAKFDSAGLTLVSTLPPEEVYVRADGRHLWRILDNLMGNCVKYALQGTRVYLDVVKWDGNVIFSLKNISANQLNLPAEELLERFVRGDESRTTDGSGLGLSIARSLTELQGGTFRLSIDGDLFKAAVSFPEAN